MDLNRKRWYVRWYFWSLGICGEFIDSYSLTRRAEQKGTNLCAFMRMILVYAPLVLLFNAVVYASLIFTFIVLPIYLFGLKGFGLGVGVLGVLGFLILMTVSLVMWLKDKRREKVCAKEQAVKTTSADVAGPGFFRVLGQWMVAKKRKVCPLITFVKNEKEANQ